MIQSTITNQCLALNNSQFLRNFKALALFPLSPFREIIVSAYRTWPTPYRPHKEQTKRCITAKGEKLMNIITIWIIALARRGSQRRTFTEIELCQRAMRCLWGSSHNLAKKTNETSWKDRKILGTCATVASFLWDNDLRAVRCYDENCLALCQGARERQREGQLRVGHKSINFIFGLLHLIIKRDSDNAQLFARSVSAICGWLLFIRRFQFPVDLVDGQEPKPAYSRNY